VLLVAIIIGYIAFFDTASRELRGSLETISKNWEADNGGKAGT
jgi:hypothetical protein